MKKPSANKPQLFGPEKILFTAAGVWNLGG